MLFLFIIAVVFVLITSRTDRLGNIRSFVVLTGSMEPSIKTHALVFTKQANYEKKDIIAFQKKDTTIVHRIVAIESKNGATVYKTKGDVNNAADSDSVNQREVLGKTVLVIPYVGYLILFLKTVPGFMIFILFPALVFIVLELLEIKKEIEHETEKRVLKKMNTA